MPEPFYFISYSLVDGEDIALRLGDQLAAGPPSIPVWLAVRNLQAGIDRDEQIVQALGSCGGLLYVMTTDGVHPDCECRQEWTRALKYKKPIIPLLFDRIVELPFRLEPREPIDFRQNFNAGLARLREHVRWRGTAEGALHTLRERLKDARRDFARGAAAERPRIQEEIAELERQIGDQRQAIETPQEAQKRTEKSIQAGLERERRPAEPISGEVHTRFINRLPMVPPVYFQDRHVETGLIGAFLKDESLRLITVVGRGGVGKTAMVCRLLRSLESGKLPDDGGALAVEGIVYLSARAGHPVNFPNLFADLCKLLPETTAKRLDQLSRDAKQSTAVQMQALLSAFPSGRTIVLLDNFEEVVDAETQAIKDRELEEALHTAVEAPPHGVKFLLTTRVAPQALLLTEPALQRTLELEKGLASPYAEEVLKAMDADGTLGLHDPGAPLDAAQKATRGYPRALEAIVGILRTDRTTTLPGVLVELQQLHPKAGNVVQVLVGEAFNRLDPLAQEVMQALAVYGAPVPAVAVDYLLQPYRVGIDSARVLGRLVNMQFVRGEAGHYYLHQVDRDYALSRVSQGEPADRAREPPPFTRYALRHRAAEYFKETRKPREAWKTLDDVAPQLSEFEVRVAGEEYDAAASVLLEIDFNYLLLWGHARLAVELHERLEGHLTDRELTQLSCGRLGVHYMELANYPRSFNYSDQALAIAREIGNRSNEGTWLNNIGSYYYQLGDYHRAIDYREQALAIARDIGNREEERFALGGLGNCYFVLGDYHRAINYHEQSLAIARDIGDRRGEGHALDNLGTGYFVLGDYHRAINYHEQSLAIARDIGNRRSEGVSLGSLGLCYDSLGDYCRAIDYQEQALAIARDIGNRRGEGHALGNLGNCYDSLGDYRRAIDYDEQSLAIARDIGDRQGEGAALGSLGTCYFVLGDYHHAINYHEQSLAIARDIGDRRSEGISLGNLGRCYFVLGDYHRAINCHEQSLAIARDIGDRRGEGAVLVCLGAVHMDTGRLGRACEYFLDASKIADATGYRQIQHAARFGLALTRLYAGDLRAAREAIDGARQFDDPQSTAAAWTATGIIRLRQGEPVAASKAFACGLAEADKLLERTGQDFSTLETKGLALCGLMLCEDEGHLLTAAKGAFAAARKITQAKGAVASVLNLFDALAIADMNGILSPARKAAEGQ